VTATSAERRGLPRGERARYRLSRSTPAALAIITLDKSLLMERVGKLPAAKLALILSALTLPLS
jgi:hypothetical protein